MRDELQEEAQFADLHRLFHDIDAEEIIDDDALVDEIFDVIMLADADQFCAELIEDSALALIRGIEEFELLRDIVGKGENAFAFPIDGNRRIAGFARVEFLHFLHAGGIERIQYFQRGEEESARAAGRVEHGDFP